jgi:hypothetical protein
LLNIAITNLQEDHISKALAGCAAGLVIAAPSKKMRHMVALCTGLGFLSGVLEVQTEQGGSAMYADPERYKHKVLGLSTKEDLKQKDYK